MSAVGMKSFSVLSVDSWRSAAVLASMGFVVVIFQNQALAGECVNGIDGGNSSSLACGGDGTVIDSAATADAFSIAIGNRSHTVGVEATAVGYSATVGESQSSAFGAYSQAGIPGSTGNTAIGEAAEAGATAAGQNDATAIGHDANANALNATALGAGTRANFANSTAIGQGVQTTAENQMAIGTAGNTYTLAGLTSGGGVKFVTTDASGNLATSTFDAQGIQDDVDQNTADIGTLNTTVGNHAILINNNTAAISTLDGRTTINETNIAVLDNRVDGLESGFADLSGEIDENRTESRQGIAAAIAMATAPMPSAPGKTTWASNLGFFKGETAFGGSLAHRFDTAIPFGVTAGYSYGGGDSHAARFGLMGEF